MKIADILRSKGPNVITVPPERQIQDAMRVLVDHNIGALVVFDGGIRGIITERDLLRCAGADVQRLTTAQVQDLMTAEVITTTPEADIREVMDVMTERRIRHLPVLDGEALCGIISIGDVVNALRQNVETENRYLHAYIAGTPL
jgi:CBS domain-containing protein